jgi:hypothetical protein
MYKFFHGEAFVVRWLAYGRENYSMGPIFLFMLAAFLWWVFQ